MLKLENILAIGFQMRVFQTLKLIGHQIKERGSMGHVNAIYVGEKIEIGADKRGSNSGQIISK